MSRTEVHMGNSNSRFEEAVQDPNLKKIFSLGECINSRDTNVAWCNTKQKNKSSAKDSLGQNEQKQHKSWLDEECSKTVKESWQSCSGYRIQTKLMHIIWTMQDVKLVDISRRKRGNIWKVKLMNMNQTVRTEIFDTHTGVEMNSTQVTSLKLN